MLSPPLQAACRAGSKRSRAKRRITVRRSSSERSWVEDGSSITPSRSSTAGDHGVALQASICRITACSTRSACSRRARCRLRSVSGRAFRGADLRGHLVTEPVDCITETGARNPAGAERLALSPQGDGGAPELDRGAREGSDCRSSISTWSAGRTHLCSTARPSCSMPMASLAMRLPAFAEVCRADALGAHGDPAGAVRKRRVRGSKRAKTADSLPARGGCATMSRRTDLKAWC